MLPFYYLNSQNLTFIIIDVPEMFPLKPKMFPVYFQLIIYKVVTIIFPR